VCNLKTKIYKIRRRIQVFPRNYRFFFLFRYEIWIFQEFFFSLSHTTHKVLGWFFHRRFFVSAGDIKMRNLKKEKFSHTTHSNLYILRSWAAKSQWTLTIKIKLEVLEKKCTKKKRSRRPSSDVTHGFSLNESTNERLMLMLMHVPLFSI
jgi:hypothetical protein